MAIKPKEDLERVEARRIISKGEGHSADYVLLFDGSFQALQMQTELRYRCVDSVQTEDGTYMGVEVLGSQ